jgi:hypothetical protein
VNCHRNSYTATTDHIFTGFGSDIVRNRFYCCIRMNTHHDATNIHSRAYSHIDHSRAISTDRPSRLWMETDTAVSERIPRHTAASFRMLTDPQRAFRFVASHYNQFQSRMSTCPSSVCTYISLTLYPRRDSRGISDIPPRYPRFTKIS